jgi:hypothetical protein
MRVTIREARCRARAIKARARPVTAGDLSGEQAAELIRIRPRRLVSWNIDPGSPGLHTVNVDAS